MKPCLLIPVYEHGAEVGEVLKGLAPTGLRCLVVDDGSGEPTRAALDELASANPWIELYRRTENGGRGAALRDGYRLAGRLGFTHVLQLDADGQHDPRDVARLLEAARAHPDALVLGRPIFDASAPALRLHARKLSQGLVWLETLSFAIRDPLCGFRCFPLRTTLRLIDRTPMGDRMDFDPEIAVRLHWAGLRIVSVPTRVVYREGGVSHYDVVFDTWLIARAHARLVAGMLVRAPLLLGRRFARRLAEWRGGPVKRVGTRPTSSTNPTSPPNPTSPTNATIATSTTAANGTAGT